ncbi:hypothetical protein IQ31_00195 [Sphingobacterium siyangense]|uniref:Uncharacterized protein n=1 Tax=Sphingobacterium siyangense TaxID=459529 RepID=A0A562N0C4_9SPHI|nr:hypothetical protein IQ31_00195 [Sphingobacterium siyangense]
MIGKLKYYLTNNASITEEHIDQISRCFTLQHVTEILASYLDITQETLSRLKSK